MTTFDANMGMTFDEATQTFITEASSIGFNGHNGFVYLYSTEMGWRDRFNHVHTQKDGEGDILKWEFEAVHDNRRLVIFND